MKEAYITFETAELAKEKGILLTDEMDCDGLFFEGRNDIYLPSQSLLARWLREKHGIHIEILSCIYWSDNIGDYKYRITRRSEYVTMDEPTFHTYEQAMEAGLQEALQLIK